MRAESVVPPPRTSSGDIADYGGLSPTDILCERRPHECVGLRPLVWGAGLGRPGSNSPGQLLGGPGRGDGSGAVAGAYALAAAMAAAQWLGPMPRPQRPK